MRMFDRIDAATLEHRDWQLWMLAMVSIFILTAGMALLMYPTVFSTSEGPGGVILRRSFVGFCILCFLLEVYLLDRQLVIRRLRKQLVEEQQLKVRIVQQASTDLLGSLPGFSHFQDRLAMEFRRAANTQQPLSLLLVVLRLAREVAGPEAAAAAQGDVAKVLIRKLRGEDSIFLFQPGVFAVVLPGVRGTDGQLSRACLHGARDGADSRALFLEGQGSGQRRLTFSRPRRKSNLRLNPGRDALRDYVL